jgi:hypothetical protein
MQGFGLGWRDISIIISNGCSRIGLRRLVGDGDIKTRSSIDYFMDISVS